MLTLCWGDGTASPRCSQHPAYSHCRTFYKVVHFATSMRNANNSSISCALKTRATRTWKRIKLQMLEDSVPTLDTSQSLPSLASRKGQCINAVLAYVLNSPRIRSRVCARRKGWFELLEKNWTTARKPHSYDLHCMLIHTLCLATD